MDDELYVAHYGDTYHCIAAHVYGDPSKADIIKEANGGIDEENLQEGQKLIVPDIPERPRVYIPERISGKDKNSLSIIIGGVEVEPESARIHRAIDCAVDGWTAVSEWRQEFGPFKYKRALVYVGGELSIHGVLYGVSPSKTKSRMDMRLEGFSITADIVDSAITGPVFQWDGQTLEQHAKTILRPFGLLPVFDYDSGEAFDTINAEPHAKVFQHLSKLAFQRSLLINSSPSGNVVFTKAKSGETVGTLYEGDNRVIKWEGGFDGRKRYRSYRGISYTPLAGDKDALAIDENVPKTRTLSFSVDDSYPWDVGYAAEWKRSKQIADSISIVLSVEGWYAPNGSLWTPNTLVTVKSETLFIPDGFTFLIKAVELVLNKNSRIANISIVPPGVYAERGTRMEDPWA